MNIKQSFTLAVKSLMGSKVRSILTMLGIIIGVGAVIIITSLINGMTDDVLSTFEDMGATNINVAIKGRGGNRSVDIDDMQQLVDDNPDLFTAMTPSIMVSGATLKNGNTSISTSSVLGVGDAYPLINSDEVEYGRHITFIDCETRISNCVIGSYVAKEFFGTSENALGEVIKLNGKDFNVVGVYEEKEESAESSSDDKIIIPYTLAQKLSNSTSISAYMFCAASKEVSAKAQQCVETYLFDVFANTDAYIVANMSSMIDTINDLTGTMSLMSACVAGISLLVGGIGIMNIMLVSVTERTREIGVRKSLGASPWDIMSQFVVEAITTSCVGGILGIIFGIVGCYIITLFDITTKLSYTSMIVSFSVSALIGVAFGYFPAKKAAALNPIDALRYD